MAIFRDTERKKTSNYRKTQSKESLKRVNNYITNEEKTGEIEEKSINELLYKKDDTIFKYVSQDKKTSTKLITGINCNPSSVYDEMMLTKKMWNKEKGRQFKHFVHSYSKDEEVLTPEMAHEITLKLLEDNKFINYEILVATHVDTKHIHSHIVVNSVNMETGRKWQHSGNDIKNIINLSNKLCEEYGLKYSFINTKKDKEYKNKQGDNYRPKNKGRSWKYESFLLINEVSKIATSKKEFIETLKKLDYHVRWEDERKNITFTLPNKKKLNNDKLHPPERFTKEALLKQFKKNKEYQADKKAFEAKVKTETLQEMYFRTVKFLFDNPEHGNKDYPMTYLEGQSLKEQMIEEAKGRGFDWEKEQER